MKGISYIFGGIEYTFIFNGAALFACYDKFGYGESPIDMITPNTAEGLDSLCWMAETLSEQGELVRRYLGYEKGPILKAAEISVLALPIDIIELRNAIVGAVAVGFKRETGEDEEIDLGLIELEKKTEKA